MLGIRQDLIELLLRKASPISRNSSGVLFPPPAGLAFVVLCRLPEDALLLLQKVFVPLGLVLRFVYAARRAEYAILEVGIVRGNQPANVCCFARSGLFELLRCDVDMRSS